MKVKFFKVFIILLISWGFIGCAGFDTMESRGWSDDKFRLGETVLSFFSVNEACERILTTMHENGTSANDPESIKLLEENRCL
ncbi:hypothetical protein H6777_01135 [Candidatus Nomurabacteria bacterium]|nr:hypothetical protein [Candidatus Nomurabacteria bacterium]